MAPPRPNSVPALALLAIGALCACGDALSTLRPSVKSEVRMFLSRRSVSLEEPQDIVAYLFTPSDEHYVTAQPDFGPGIAVEFDSGAGEGCTTAPPLTDPVPDLWETTYVFPICLTLIPQAQAPPGLRTVVVEVDSAGALLVQTAELTFVAPAGPSFAGAGGTDAGR